MFRNRSCGSLFRAGVCPSPSIFPRRVRRPRCLRAGRDNRADRYGTNWLYCMFSAIFSSPRRRNPMSGVALVMISPSSSSTSRKTPCVAGCDGPMLRTIFSPISSSPGWRSAASAAANRVTGSGDSISRVVNGISSAINLRCRVNHRAQAQFPTSTGWHSVLPGYQKAALALAVKLD